MAEDEQLQAAIIEARKVKVALIEPAIRWYKSHLLYPFIMFRTAGVLTVLLSVSLPTVALVDFRGQKVVVAVMSATIAALSALGAFYHWERTWRSRTVCLDAIEYAVAKWELEIHRAKILIDSPDRAKHVLAATDDLLLNFRSHLTTETESFFTGMQLPQSERASGNLS